MTTSDRIRELAELERKAAAELEELAAQLETVAADGRRRGLRNEPANDAAAPFCSFFFDAIGLAGESRRLGFSTVAETISRRPLEELKTWEGRAFALEQAAAKIRAGAELKTRRADRGAADPLNRLRARNAAGELEPIAEAADHIEQERADLAALRRVEARDTLEESSLEDLTWARRAASRRIQTAKGTHGGQSPHTVAARAAHNRISAEIERRHAEQEHSGSRRLEILEQEAPHLIADRLEELRAELRAERISYGELAELADLAEHIDPGDVELLEAAGIPEFAEEPERRPEPTTPEGATAHDLAREILRYGVPLPMQAGVTVRALARLVLASDNLEEIEPDEPAGAGTDPRPDPRTHPEAWTE